MPESRFEPTDEFKHQIHRCIAHCYQRSMANTPFNLRIINPNDRESLNSLRLGFVINEWLQIATCSRIPSGTVVSVYDGRRGELSVIALSGSRVIWSEIISTDIVSNRHWMLSIPEGFRVFMSQRQVEGYLQYLDRESRNNAAINSVARAVNDVVSSPSSAQITVGDGVEAQVRYHPINPSSNTIEITNDTIQPTSENNSWNPQTTEDIRRSISEIMSRRPRASIHPINNLGTAIEATSPGEPTSYYQNRPEWVIHPVDSVQTGRFSSNSPNPVSSSNQGESSMPSSLPPVIQVNLVVGSFSMINQDDQPLLGNYPHTDPMDYKAAISNWVRSRSRNRVTNIKTQDRSICRVLLELADEMHIDLLIRYKLRVNGTDPLKEGDFRYTATGGIPERHKIFNSYINML